MCYLATVKISLFVCFLYIVTKTLNLNMVKTYNKSKWIYNYYHLWFTGTRHTDQDFNNSTHKSQNWFWNMLTLYLAMMRVLLSFGILYSSLCLCCSFASFGNHTFYCSEQFAGLLKEKHFSPLKLELDVYWLLHSQVMTFTTSLPEIYFTSETRQDKYLYIH